MHILTNCIYFWKAHIVNTLWRKIFDIWGGADFGPYSSQSFGEAIKYFVFTVLAFGLSSTGYIFTKVVRPIVAHLRKDGIKVTVYLDDGLGLADNEKVC